MPKALDLTNKRFGSLVAVKKAESRNKKTYWLCKCDCGDFKEVQTCHLVSGAIKSCGKKSCKVNSFVNFEEDKKECPICGKTFVPNNIKRKYCYECVPIGLPSNERLKRMSHLVKHKLILYKGGKCEKCGYNKCEGALHFHHLNPKEKEFTVSQINLNEYFTLEKLYREVDKCVLLCANCHAEEHYSE